MIHILGEVIQALETLECLLLLYANKTIARLQNAWLVWSSVIPIITVYINYTQYAQEEDSKLG